MKQNRERDEEANSGESFRKKARFSRVCLFFLFKALLSFPTSPAGREKRRNKEKKIN
jgi:hypothetical protein